MGTKVLAVFRADSLEEGDFRLLLEAASPKRRERARRFREREDACRSLVAEALVRRAFMLEAGLDVDESYFRYNAFGKPHIPGTGLHFNIAHSGAWVICGIDAEELGVDIERHHEVRSGIAARFFAPEENALLEETRDPSERSRLFFQIWALKESYVKAIGKGLSCAFEDFACLPDRLFARAVPSQPAAFIARNPALPRGHLRLLEVHPDYSCAICSLRPASIPELVRIEVGALVDSPRRRHHCVP